MKRNALTPAVLFVIAALALAGCSAAGMNESASDSGSVGIEELQTVAGEAEGTDLDAAQDRQLVTTGYLTITADDPIAAASDAIAIAERAGGRIDARSEDAPVNGDAGSAQVTLRLPSKTLTQTIDDIKALGTVEVLSLSSIDVTTEAQDLDARIAATTASLDRLLGLLTTANTTETVLALETAITERQGNLESMQAQRRLLADQVSLSTLQLDLISVADAPADEPDTFLSGLLAGWGGFVAFFSALLVLFGVLLPWLVLTAVIAAIVLVLVRRSRPAAGATAEPSP